jgi:hypothetical protein
MLVPFIVGFQFDTNAFKVNTKSHERAWAVSSFLTAKDAKKRERRLGLILHFGTTENTEYTEGLGLIIRV